MSESARRAAHPVSVRDVAAVCGGRLVGDSDLLLTGVRSLSLAGPHDLSFAAGAKQEREAQRSPAGALLMVSAAAFPDRTVVEVPDPPRALSKVLPLFFAPRSVRPGVHATAIVGEGAVVDPTAEVGPYAVIGAGSVIGPGCLVEAHSVLGEGCVLAAGARLHAHVVLYDGVVVGARSEVHSGAVLGADGFGYASGAYGIEKIPQVGTVEIGDDVEIGANSCVDRATLEVTRVGSGTKVDDLVMVGHNCEIGRFNFLCGQVGLAGSTVTGDGVVMGGQVGVAGHVRIGNGVRVGAQSGVRGDVPDRAEVFGSPILPAKDAMRIQAELKRLPETARLVRRLVAEREKRSAE